MNAYSLDLRESVLAFVDAGHSYTEAGQRLICLERQ